MPILPQAQGTKTHLSAVTIYFRKKRNKANFHVWTADLQRAAWPMNVLDALPNPRGGSLFGNPTYRLRDATVAGAGGAGKSASVAQLEPAAEIH